MTNQKEPVYYKSSEMISALDSLKDKFLAFSMLVTLETPPFHRFPEDVKKDIEKAGYQISIHPQTLGSEYYDEVRITNSWTQNLPKKTVKKEPKTFYEAMQNLSDAWQRFIDTIIKMIWK